MAQSDRMNSSVLFQVQVVSKYSIIVAWATVDDEERLGLRCCTAGSSDPEFDPVASVLRVSRCQELSLRKNSFISGDKTDVGFAVLDDVVQRELFFVSSVSRSDTDPHLDAAGLVKERVSSVMSWVWSTELTILLVQGLLAKYSGCLLAQYLYALKSTSLEYTNVYLGQFTEA